MRLRFAKNGEREGRPGERQVRLAENDGVTLAIDFVNSINSDERGLPQSEFVTYLRTGDLLLKERYWAKTVGLANTYAGTHTRNHRVPGAIPDVPNSTRNGGIGDASRYNYRSRAGRLNHTEMNDGGPLSRKYLDCTVLSR